jgi:hypothetical protein
VHDPAPKIIRPLLGIWSERPDVQGGRMPRPELVYRCDEERSALLCVQGAVVVHEAWVDTGPRQRSKPRWVAADVGIALPQRRALLGRWYLGNLLAGERPIGVVDLTLRSPHPTAEVAAEPPRLRTRFRVALLRRLGGLAAIGGVCYVISQAFS